MEKLFVPSSFPKTCLNYQIPPKVENSPDVHPKSRKKNLSFIKKKEPNIIPDEQLDYLCRNGSLLEAEKALDSLFQQGSKVKRSTYLNLLESCIDSGSIHLGRILHARFGLFPEPDVFVETKLLSMYAKCGCLVDARKVFDSMRERNLYTWSAMIGAYSRENRWREVSKLFRLMMEDGVLPDDFLFPKILQGCANCGDVETGKLIHSVVIKLGMSSCLRVSNSILAVYAKCGDLDSAAKFFRRMKQRDVVAWNTVLLAYCQNGKHEEAVGLVEEMEKEGIAPGLVTWNILIGGYNQLGKCDTAMDLMQKMERFGLTADVFTWTAMISGLIHNGMRFQALDMFRKMFLAGVVPNGVTIMSAVSACSCLKVLNLGSEVHSVAVKMGFIDDVLVGNSLVDMYSKCGELEDARKVFDSVKNKDVYTWNSMITGYCQAGYCGKAYELFIRMQDANVRPNIITWNTMISGYIKNGDEGEAMDLFQRMEKDGKVQRNTASWNLIIAGYIQNGKKEEALELFRKMQFSRFMPNSVTILSLLPACANLLGTKMVREIHGCVLRRNLDAIHAVKNALTDTYAKSGDIGYSRTIFNGMETKDIITWNSLIGGYVLHGSYGPALDLFNQMKTLGIKPNRGTLASIILAHGLMGNIDEGKKPASVGPWGGQSGHAWDDGMYTTVRQIIIGHGSSIDSIQVEYEKNGSSVWSEKRGGKGGKKIDNVKLDYPHEYLISVNGTYGSFDAWGNTCVRSLTLESNHRKYGPFGCESGTFFALPKSGSKIIGFHGKAGWYIDAIGVHIQPIPKENHPPSKIVLHSHQNFPHGDKKHEYSVIQGSVGQNFDIVVALRQKNPNLPSNESRDHAGAEIPKQKLVTDTEKPQSKAVGGAKTYGPWGGTGGIVFDDGIYTGIRQINLSRSVGVVSIKVCYDFKGQAVWGSKHGGTGGFRHDKIVFDYPSEVLTHVTGTYGPLVYLGPNVIKSLTFRTNKGKHGPFGEEHGPTFTHKIDEGKVVGFLGREGLFLDAIGVHVMECKISSLKPSSPQHAIVPFKNSGTAEIENSPWANKLVLAANGHGEEVEHGVVKEPTPSGPGPWGGDGGQSWDDGVYSGIKQIFVTRGNDAISSIQVEYDRNGQSVWSTKHGGNNGVATHRIKLEYPNETLTCISGFYGPLNNSDRSNVVKSLSFFTSRGKYGPYGEESGTFFTSTTTHGKVLGFHGRCSSNLDAIGVHMQHWLGNKSSYVSRASCFKLF
ncbi:PREDICTED: pentatricopeptide repeat-containing protein At1g19720-like isoform X2 [Camelina sativa]|uniref:Pentatricopeptide repeat-containing protein At1g19720-like isoform X2 n=1 Tax=Camelina sativa TaxID=90675 RepID=A0ABM0YB55_CAMSA|nr:PREDICTED: pentatricopeptide repeat-containing protein At1g19720-like isoform X2 [Camelina sativa]